MAKPRVLILRAPGTNCDAETAHAFQLAGGRPEVWHLNRLLSEPHSATDFQVLCLPGGFSYGDDLAAGRIFANQIRHHLADALRAFHNAGGLILGICNGFQVLIKSGLLDTVDTTGPAATLAWNDSGRFSARWVCLRVESSRSVFLSGIDQMFLPIAHAEGKFVALDEPTLDRLEQAGQLVLRYRPAGESATDGAADVPAYNPNGAMRDVAGMCDATGRVLGMMPHPERFVDPTQHPWWTRLSQLSEEGEGLPLFRNAVRYFL